MPQDSFWLALLLVLAGCLSPAGPRDGAGGVPPSDVPEGLSAHQAAGAVPVPAAWLGLRARVAATGFRAGEPTVAATSTGTLFTVGVDPASPDIADAGPLVAPVLLRSRDGGASWAALEVPLGPAVNGDPWVWADPATDRVFDANLWGGCLWMAWSDDGGASWAGNPAGGCGVPAHDYSKLVTGPPPAGVATQGYPSIVYESYQPIRPDASLRGEATEVVASLDGGATWGLPAVAHAPDPCMAGLAPPLAVAPDGAAYLAKPVCDGVDVVRSADAGATWTPVAQLRGAGMMGGGALSPIAAGSTDVAVDADGTLYVAQAGSDGAAWVWVGRQSAEAWSGPVRASPPGLGATAFENLVVGRPGEVAMAFLGTDAVWDSRTPDEAPADTTWHLWVAATPDARAVDPRWVTLRVTPLDDPVQVGCIAAWSNPCSNLWDFLGVTGQGGRAFVSFTDGCDRCATDAESDRMDGMVAVVDGLWPS